MIYNIPVVYTSSSIVLLFYYNFFIYIPKIKRYVEKMFFFLFKKKCWKFLFYLFLAVPLRPLPFGVSGELWWRGTCIRKKKGKFFSSILFLDVAGCMAISLNRRIFFYSFYSSLLSLSLLVEVCAHYHLHIYSFKKKFSSSFKKPKTIFFFLVSRYIGLKPPGSEIKEKIERRGGGGI